MKEIHTNCVYKNVKKWFFLTSNNRKKLTQRFRILFFSKERNLFSQEFHWFFVPFLFFWNFFQHTFFFSFWLIFAIFQFHLIWVQFSVIFFVLQLFFTDFSPQNPARFLIQFRFRKSDKNYDRRGPSLKTHWIRVRVWSKKEEIKTSKKNIGTNQNKTINIQLCSIELLR